MLTTVRNFINSIFLPNVDGNYVSNKLDSVIQLHGITVGESNLTFRGFDAMGEYRYPLKGSESTENRIMFKDIAIINERCSFWEILLWNGYIYTVSKEHPRKHLHNTYRDVRNMSYFTLRRMVTAKEVSRNITNF